MLSNFGYWEFFRSKCKINVYFLPAFTIAVQFLLLFLPGLLNFLGFAAWVIYLCGFVLLVDALQKEKLRILNPYLNWGYVFLVLSVLLIAVVIKGRLFTWIDCFTHWAVVTKNMLQADRFPTFAQSAVSFTSYPLGSSTTIFYFCKMTSREEDVQMLAQAFMMLSMFLPVFSCIKKNHAACVVFLTLMANLLLCYNIPVTELLVDTLLPLTAMATILFVYQEYLDRERRTTRIAAYYALPFLFLIMNIKNSGIFFVLIALALLLFARKREGKNLIPVFNICLILFAGVFLWNRHCDYVFANSAASQHAVSAIYFSGRLAEKTWNDLWLISKGVIKFMVIRQELLWLLLWLAVLGVLTWIFASPLKKRYICFLVFSVMQYVLYTVSLWGMYICSMPVIQALDLESIDRYSKTIDIAIYYGIMVYVLLLVAQIGRTQLRMGVSLLLIALLVGTWKIPDRPIDNVMQVEYDPKMRLQLKELLDEYGVEKGFSYLIIYADQPTMYPMYVCRYYLDTSKVGQVVVTEKSQMEIEKDYDYIILFGKENLIVDEWIRETYPEQAGQQIIQCFK